MSGTVSMMHQAGAAYLRGKRALEQGWAGASRGSFGLAARDLRAPEQCSFITNYAAVSVPSRLETRHAMYVQRAFHAHVITLSGS